MKKNAKDNQAGFTLIEVIVSLVVAAIMASMIYTYFGNALTQSSVPIFRLQKASNLQKVMENIIADYERLNQLNLRFKWRADAEYKVGEFVLPSDGFVTKDSKIANNGRYYICTQAGTSHSTIMPGWTITTPPTNGAEFSDNTVKWKEHGYVWQANTSYDTTKVVVPIINNGHFYKCKTGGISDATEPAATSWLPDPVPSIPWDITDNTVTWTEVGTILNSTAVSDNLSALLPAVNDPILSSETETAKIRYGKGYTVTEKVFIQFIPGASSSDPYQEASAGTENNILKVTIKNNDSAETLTQIFTIR